MRHLSAILHPVTYAASATPALSQACALARWYGADLHLVHVAAGDPSATAEAAEHARLREFVEARAPRGVRIERAILFGNAIKAVAEYARRFPRELLVVSRQRGRHSTVWRPRVAANALARQVDCPTLMVPEGAGHVTEPAATFREILCATDFSASATAALERALTLAELSGGRLTMLHVLDGLPYETVYSGSRAYRLIEEYRRLSARMAQEMRSSVSHEGASWCDVRARAVSGIPHRAILAAAAELDVDLIVMGLPQRRGLEKVLVPSTTRAVVRRASCPVLMVPGPDGPADRRAVSESCVASGRAVRDECLLPPCRDRVSRRT